MAFFENYRVYVLTSVAYLGSFLFGEWDSRESSAFAAAD